MAQLAPGALARYRLAISVHSHTHPSPVPCPVVSPFTAPVTSPWSRSDHGAAADPVPHYTGRRSWPRGGHTHAAPADRCQVPAARTAPSACAHRSLHAPGEPPWARLTADPRQTIRATEGHTYTPFGAPASGCLASHPRAAPLSFHPRFSARRCGSGQTTVPRQAFTASDKATLARTCAHRSCQLLSGSAVARSSPSRRSAPRLRASRCGPCQTAVPRQTFRAPVKSHTHARAHRSCQRLPGLTPAHSSPALRPAAPYVPLRSLTDHGPPTDHQGPREATHTHTAPASGCLVNCRAQLPWRSAPQLRTSRCGPCQTTVP